MSFASLSLFLLLSIQFSTNGNSHYLSIPKKEIEKKAIQHLETWFPRVIDTVFGGYYTNFEYNWERSPDQSKMLVTQARNLWTASKAAQLFPENKTYERAAIHGFNYLTTIMWDAQKGGYLLYLEPGASHSDSPYKLIYGNAFALYALAEFARIHPSAEVFQWIRRSFNWIDSVAHDNESGGYFNLVFDDSLRKDNLATNLKYIRRLGWGDPEWKDQNNSIHLLEAFTAAYLVLPEPEIKIRLQEMLILVRDTMTGPDGYLTLYFEKNWKPVCHADSSREFILRNQLTDHISFGHNIETAYLLIDASKALYGEPDKKTLLVAKKLTDHTLKHGFGPGFYGLYDRGYLFDGVIEIIGPQKTWWSQFEALHTLALMHQYFPDENRYIEGFSKMWEYIDLELTDPVYGGVYNNGLDTSPGDARERKAHNWKSPYHDGRALMMIWEYANRE